MLVLWRRTRPNFSHIARQALRHAGRPHFPEWRRGMVTIHRKISAAGAATASDKW